MESNDASLRANTVERPSVPLEVTPNNEKFLPDMLLKIIQVGIPYFHHESNRNIDLLYVRDA
jgi:hypothetical protein